MCRCGSNLARHRRHTSAASAPANASFMMPPDGTGAPAALRAAAQAIIDLPGRARRGFAGRQRGAHVMIGEHVAGADDHARKARRQNGTFS